MDIDTAKPNVLAYLNLEELELLVAVSRFSTDAAGGVSLDLSLKSIKPDDSSSLLKQWQEIGLVENNSNFYPREGWSGLSCMIRGIVRSDNFTKLCGTAPIDDLLDDLDLHELLAEKESVPGHASNFDTFEASDRLHLLALPISSPVMKNFATKWMTEEEDGEVKKEVTTRLLRTTSDRHIVSDCLRYFSNVNQPSQGTLWCLAIGCKTMRTSVEVESDLSFFANLLTDMTHAEWYFWCVTRCMLWRNVNFCWNRSRSHLSALALTKSMMTGEEDLVCCQQCARVWQGEYLELNRQWEKERKKRSGDASKSAAKSSASTGKSNTKKRVKPGDASAKSPPPGRSSKKGSKKAKQKEVIQELVEDDEDTMDTMKTGSDTDSLEDDEVVDWDGNNTSDTESSYDDDEELEYVVEEENYEEDDGEE